MRLLKYLTEKYLTSLKDYHIIKNNEFYVEIFVNPSKKEFNDAAGKASFDHWAGRYVRFYADMKKKKVYIWNPETIHDDIWKKIGDGRSYNNSTLLSGVAQLIGGKWTMFDSDEGVKHILRDYKPSDWEWVDKWIRVTPYLEEHEDEAN